MIWCARADLVNSFQAVFRRHPEEFAEPPVVRQLLPGKIRQSFHIGWLLMRARANGTSVDFFHECCWVEFDVAIKLVRTRSRHFPQADFSHFPVARKLEVIAGERPLAHKIKFICASILFSFREVQELGRVALSPVLRRYPKTVDVHEVVRNGHKAEDEICKSRKVLLLGGVDFVPAQAMVRCFAELSEKLASEEIECFYKDHPNAEARSGRIPSSRVTELDPLLPAEALADEFEIVVGVFSLSLLAFSARAFTVAEIWKDEFPTEFCEREEFFTVNAGVRQVRSCDSVNEVVSEIVCLLSGTT